MFMTGSQDFVEKAAVKVQLYGYYRSCAHKCLNVVLGKAGC